MRRRIKWSVLAVGEGDAEVAFLEHLKKIYIFRECGTSLTIKPAHGKGAGNVVSHALRYSDSQGYDRCLVLFDTDEGYSEDVKNAAREAKLVTIPSEPCFEALLLKCHGDTKIRSSDEHKSEFFRRFGGRVQDDGVIPNFFSKEALEDIRDKEPLIHKLVNTFGISRFH